MYATFCAYDSYTFGARQSGTAYLTIDLKILSGHFVYAYEDNAGSETFLVPLLLYALSMGSMYAQFSIYHGDIFGARAIRMSTIVISGSMITYANEGNPGS